MVDRIGLITGAVMVGFDKAAGTLAIRLVDGGKAVFDQRTGAN